MGSDPLGEANGLAGLTYLPVDDSATETVASLRHEQRFVFLGLSTLAQIRAKGLDHDLVEERHDGLVPFDFEAMDNASLKVELPDIKTNQLAYPHPCVDEHLHDGHVPGFVTRTRRTLHLSNQEHQVGNGQRHLLSRLFLLTIEQFRWVTLDLLLSKEPPVQGSEC